MNRKAKTGIGIAAAGVLAAAAICICREYAPWSVTDSTIDTLRTVEVPAPELLYDIPRDSFLIEEYEVRRHENLSDIMLKAGVDYARINELAAKAEPVFSTRRIRAGNRYTAFCSPDSLHRLMHWVYVINPTDYLVCSLAGDSTHVELRHKDVGTRRRTASARISSSLWNAIAGRGLTPALALELSDIYAWTVDFFGIEEGDYFKVVYTENVVDSVAVSIGSIECALFVHRGRSYYAFRYEQDSTAGYFDLEGNSLRRAFLKAPLKFSRISSRFSNGRMHPVLKIRRPHHGVDYAAPAGTPVYAIGDGHVTARGWDHKGGGNYLKIRHNSVYTSVYMHLRGFAKGIAKGSSVRQGELIGFVGATGLATGPHLDFRVYKGGSPIDPLRMEAPPVEPVSNDNIQRFIIYSDSLRAVIDALPLDN